MKIINWFKNNYILTIILLVAIFLRFYKIDFQSFAIDEVLTMNNSNPKLTLKEFYDSVMFWEFIPHLYFFLLRLVFEIFGYSTLIARGFAAVIGVFGVFSIYLLAKELFDKKSGLIASALLCVNSFHIFFSQETRPYGMLLLFTTIAFYRLVIFIKKPILKNAIYHGIFAGLIINAHFFGFISLFAQYLTLLFFIIKTPKENKKSIFINSFISGFVSIIVLLPTYEAFFRVTNITSFWLEKPGPNAFSLLFNDFFGNSEILLFLINFVVIFYVINLFKEKIKNYEFETILNNKIIFSFIIIFVWILISLTIPLIRSYISVPMILSRYFINIIPAILILITSGICYIENKLIKIIFITSLITFSLINLFIVKNYYNTPTKTQFRELTEEIIKRNPEKSKVVAFYSWIIPFFFRNEPQIKVEANTLEDYVSSIKSGKIPQKAFWYTDVKGRPFSLNNENQLFMDTYFNLNEKIDFMDVWAYYYVPKKEEKINIDKDFNISLFSPIEFDKDGNVTLLNNINLKTDFIAIDKGNYSLILNASSLPEIPINGENAHFKIKLNGLEIANLNLSENSNSAENIVNFSYNKDEKVRFQIIFDNDFSENGKDRNALIRSIRLEKK